MSVSVKVALDKRRAGIMATGGSTCRFACTTAAAAPRASVQPSLGSTISYTPPTSIIATNDAGGHRPSAPPDIGEFEPCKPSTDPNAPPDYNIAITMPAPGEMSAATAFAPGHSTT
eukprot:scpid98463/ scgid24804/ 